jgi:sugar lactone lactonase YvrE
MRALVVPTVLLQTAFASLSAVPLITAQPESRTVGAGCTISFSVGVAAAGQFTYQWQHEGTNLPNGIITTVAGSEQVDDSRDGVVALSAGFGHPCGVAVDTFGNLYVGDNGPVSNSVHKISTNGIVSSIPRASGSFGASIGLVTDAAGNLFVCGSRQGDPERVRKVDTHGHISVLAGARQTFISGSGSIAVRDLGDGGPAIRAQLNGPSGLAVDGSGNLFIADEFSDRVRKVSPEGIITTVAGNGDEGFSRDGRAAINTPLHWPSGVAVDSSGNLFIAESGNKLIRKVNPNGIITTLAGGGTERVRDGLAATNVDLYIVSGGLAVDISGNVFFSTFHQVRKVDTNGIITTVAGDTTQGCTGDGGPAVEARLSLTQGVAVDRYGNLFIADAMCKRIRKVGNTKGPTLVLHNVTDADAGNYQVVVTGEAGSVTSSMAALTIVR